MNKALLGIVAIIACASATPCAAQEVVPPDDPVEGHTQGEWSSRWWQWAGSFKYQDSPVADRTGALCDRKQTGAVWFLAGTYGTQRTTRTCKVPKGKYLFFPLINYVIFPPASTACSSTCCDHYADTARAATDAPADLILEVDGKRIANLDTFRQVSPACFDLGALATPPSRVFPSAANGYYAMLRPLPPGKHVLNFGGRLPGMSQAVTYTLYVE